MKIYLLTLTIFLLSFIFASHPASQNTSSYKERVVHANTYSEFEMYLKYIRTHSKCMYGDAITITMHLEQDTSPIALSSWGDVKFIIDENTTAEKKGN